MRRRPAIEALLVAAGLLGACTKPEDPCSDDSLKNATASAVSSWYLYPELLPRTVDLGAYHGPADLLDALTANARAQGMDRSWSYLTTLDAQQQFFAEGTFVGFGIGVLLRGNQLFVAQVYPSSAASTAGFKRGDEITAIGTADPLTPISTLVANRTTDEANQAIGDAFGPATIGLQRLFDVIPLNGSTAERRSMFKTTYGLDPVPAPVIFNRDGGLPPVGYLALRTFIPPADPLLTAAFAQFQTAGVKDLIVDLRYNGGGVLTTAEVLLNLIGGGLDKNIMFELGFNLHHQDQNFIDYYAPDTSSLTPDHVAFLVTNASASASELVPNALAPWRPVALVGHQTYGKPVGQVAFPNYQCGLVLNLVSFRLSNSEGNADYYTGLPSTGFTGCGIAADDDLTHETSDPAETQTKAALDWLSGQWSQTPPPCPTLSGALSVTGPARPADTYPRAARPAEAQRHLPGLF